MFKNKAIFLDRDGTLCRWVHHIHRLSDIYVYRQALKALELLQINTDYKLIIITNQAAVAKGKMTEKKALEIHSKIIKPFLEKSIHFQDQLLCFEHPDGLIPKYKKDSENRKPNIGFAKYCQQKYLIDLQRSYMIGDNLSDVEFGNNFGGKSILVKTGLGKRYVNDNSLMAQHIATDLLAAAKYIISIENS